MWYKLGLRKFRVNEAPCCITFTFNEIHSFRGVISSSRLPKLNNSSSYITRRTQVTSTSHLRCFIERLQASSRIFVCCWPRHFSLRVSLSLAMDTGEFNLQTQYWGEGLPCNGLASHLGRSGKYFQPLFKRTRTDFSDFSMTLLNEFIHVFIYL